MTDTGHEPNHAPIGNVDRQAQANGSCSGVATAKCDHHYEVRILGGHPISVRACIFCRTPDWADLYEQAGILFRWGREEGLAGKPPRERLSAYDRPRDDQEPPTATEATDPATALAELLACLYPITRAGDTAPIGWQAIHPIRPADHQRWTDALEGAGGVDADEQEAANAYQQMLDTPPSAAICAAIKARLESGDVPRRTVRRRPTATETRLPDDVLALLPPGAYLCDPCRTARSLHAVTLGQPERAAALDLDGHRGRLHGRCQIRQPWTGLKCRCRCRPEE
ncbi:hypothetical protein [Streptomyces sp. NPDC047990]|uniref:hypothetical protein n=1 Tax=Streptomyces sp. NPDC047990 TaxID=3365496 RepID=UPI00371051D8